MKEGVKMEVIAVTFYRNFIKTTAQVWKDFTVVKSYVIFEILHFSRNDNAN